MRKPKIFIASSVEGVDVAYFVQEILEYDAEVTIWNQGTFQLSSNTLDDLIDVLPTTDFGIFVFTPDDALQIREEELPSVRDNVIFELGMFIGRLGKKRCFIVCPRTEHPFHIPTDLLGVTPAMYDPEREDGNLSAALGPACNKIRQAIESVQRLQQTEEPKSQESIDTKPEGFNELMRAFDTATFTLQEQTIKADLEKENLTEGEGIEVLIRHLANAQIALAFNDIDHHIWGSQVELLQYLNSSSGSTADGLRNFYDIAVSRSGDLGFASRYTFDQYLQFLKSQGVITELGGVYFISQVGRDFLIFLTSKGAPKKSF